MPKKSTKQSPYSLHPSYAMEAGYAKNLFERTGKTMEEWVEIVKRSGPPTEKERRAWLKDVLGFTTNYAWWVAERAEGRGSAAQYDPEALVEALFAGGKAGLRPLYDRLLALGLKLGPDVKVCPCQTMVPFYRKHVFAQIKPTTRTRIDFGLALAKVDKPMPERLIDTGGLAKKDRITHRFALQAATDIDKEVEKWFKIAYEACEKETA
jgi:hypothetical protein